jgi:hypothetical protein
MVEKSLDEEISNGFQECGRLDDASENIRVCLIKNYPAEAGDKAFCINGIKSVRILNGKQKQVELL